MLPISNVSSFFAPNLIVDIFQSTNVCGGPEKPDEEKFYIRKKKEYARVERKKIFQSYLFLFNLNWSNECRKIFILYCLKKKPNHRVIFPPHPPKKQNRLLPSHFLFSYSSYVFDVWMHIEWLWDELRDPSCMLNLLLYKRCHSKKKEKEQTK